MEGALQAALDEAGKVVKKQKTCAAQSEVALQCAIDAVATCRGALDAGQPVEATIAQLLARLKVCYLRAAYSQRPVC